MNPTNLKGSLPPPKPGTHLVQPQEITQRENAPPHLGLRRRLLVWVIHFATSLYQTFILLGLHWSYLRNLASPSSYSSENRSTVPLQSTPSSSAPEVELAGPWGRKCSSLVKSFRRKYAPVVANGSALYHVTTSIRSSDSSQGSIASTIGIISVIISANSVILSTFFLHYAPALGMGDCPDSIPKPSERAHSDVIIDRRTQAAMLMSIPSASTFWALSSLVVYHSSGFALSQLTSNIMGNPMDKTMLPWWSTTLIYTTILLCLVHFFGIVVWLGHLEGLIDGATSTNTTLPLPCTTAGRRTSAQTSFEPPPLQKGVPLTSKLTAAGPQSSNAELDGPEAALANIPSHDSVTAFFANELTLCEQSDNTVRRSRKDAISPGRYPRTPSASPSRTRKHQKKRATGGRSNESQERAIEAPQVIRCTSSSGQNPSMLFSMRSC